MNEGRIELQNEPNFGGVEEGTEGVARRSYRMIRRPSPGRPKAGPWLSEKRRNKANSVRLLTNVDVTDKSPG